MRIGTIQLEYPLTPWYGENNPSKRVAKKNSVKEMVLSLIAIQKMKERKKRGGIDVLV